MPGRLGSFPELVLHELPGETAERHQRHDEPERDRHRGLLAQMQRNDDQHRDEHQARRAGPSLDGAHPEKLFGFVFGRCHGVLAYLT